MKREKERQVRVRGTNLINGRGEMEERKSKMKDRRNEKRKRGRKEGNEEKKEAGSE